MINYYSGGAHCCAEHFLFDLSDWANLVRYNGTHYIGGN